MCIAEQPPLILIATPNAPKRVALARLVARHGMTALACFDGTAILASAYAERQDVCGAILDPAMPSIDVERIACALREETGLVDTFILAGYEQERGPIDRAQDCRGLTPGDLERIDAWLQRLIPAPTSTIHGVALAL
ncbi:MAG: hypothetical protein HGA45_25450 [Chloroflexales bacterium]|nr:hypothetical protein [Chloroflexales bacterium]